MSKNKQAVFKGAATALVTPFKNGEVDYKSLGVLIDRQIDLGIDALVICGTTGEASTLSTLEHKRVLSFSLERAGGRVPMIVDKSMKSNTMPENRTEQNRTEQNRTEQNRTEGVSLS